MSALNPEMAGKINFRQVVRQYWMQTPGASLPYGVGCAWVRNYADQAKLREGVETLLCAYNNGARYFDTSESYGDSEQLVGEFVRMIPRQSIFLATKSRLPYLNSADAVAHIQNNLERSLQRLNTDFLDLFQLHDIDTRYEAGGVQQEVLDYLETAQKSGIIRCFGMAVRPHRILEQAIKQGQYSSILTFSDFTPINQSAKEVIKMAANAGVGVINGSPLGNKWFTGADPRERDCSGKPDLLKERSKVIVFYDFCKARGVSILAAALQFPLRNAEIDMTLSGPASATQWTQSLKALQEPVPPSFWTEWERYSRITKLNPNA